MRLGELVGHERPAALLQRSLLSGRVSNAYLFVGEEGIGKATAAVAFGSALVCEHPSVRPEAGVFEACGVCPACVLTAAGNHPHLRRIAPDGERIRIDQMRDLRRDVSLTAFGGGRRVYIIDGAERMTEEAANCILKTLEEPPPGVTLVLVTENPAQLLPTILSRCQLVRFRPAPVSAVQTFLAERLDVPDHHARSIASLSGGRTGWAVRAAQRPAILGVRERLLALLQRLPDAGPVFAFRAAEEVRTLARDLAAASMVGQNAEDLSAPDDTLIRAATESLLDLARAWFRDLLVLKLAKGQPLLNDDCRAELGTIASRHSVEQIHRALEALAQTRYYLSRNANSALALEVLMARLLPAG